MINGYSNLFEGLFPLVNKQTDNAYRMTRTRLHIASVQIDRFAFTFFPILAFSMSAPPTDAAARRTSFGVGDVIFCIDLITWTIHPIPTIRCRYMLALCTFPDPIVRLNLTD